jgi:hypothetical protein
VYRVLAAVNKPSLSKDTLNEDAAEDGFGYNVMFAMAPHEAAAQSLESLNNGDFAAEWDTAKCGIHLEHKLEPVDDDESEDDPEAVAARDKKKIENLVQSSFPASTLKYAFEFACLFPLLSHSAHSAHSAVLCHWTVRTLPHCIRTLH